jgi:hypothetical protein
VERCVELSSENIIFWSHHANGHETVFYLVIKKKVSRSSHDLMNHGLSTASGCNSHLSRNGRHLTPIMRSPIYYMPIKKPHPNPTLLYRHLAKSNLDYVLRHFPECAAKEDVKLFAKSEV